MESKQRPENETYQSSSLSNSAIVLRSESALRGVRSLPSSSRTPSEERQNTQNINFKANCSCRGALALAVTVAPDAASIAPPGGLKLGVFVRLNASARNWRRIFSPRENCLNRERFTKWTGPA